MCSSTENRCLWATLTFVPSNLWTSAVTRPEGIFCTALAQLLPLCDPWMQTLWHADIHSLALILKASWEDSLTSFISIKMHCSSFHWLDFPLQQWRRCPYHAEPPIAEASSDCYTKADCRQVGSLKSEAAFKLILFKWCSGFPCNYWHNQYFGQFRLVAESWACS